MAKGVLKVKIIGDERDLAGALKRAHKHVSDFGSKAGTALKVGLLGAGGAAIGGLTAVVATGVREFSDYQKGLAQANAVIKSTGGAAGVTSKHVEDMASALQAQTGATDDSVVAGENLLLTFTKIQNTAGKNNDIFDQATKTVLDMSQALGEDTSSAAIQLGKALQDPVLGMTALRRVGVNFTKDQQTMVAGWVKHGQTLKAQKFILHELNTEFGGSAKAFGNTLPGQLAKAKRAFEDVSQSIIGAAVPAFTSLIGGAQKFITNIGPKVGEAFKGLKAGFSEGITGEGGIAGVFEAIGNAAYNFVAILKSDVIPFIKDVLAGAFATLSKIVRALLPVFSAVFGFVKKNVLPVLLAIGEFIVKHVFPAVAKLVAIIGGALVSVFHSVSKAIDQHRQQFVKLGEFLKVIIGFILRYVVPVIGVILGTAFRIAGKILGIFIGVIGDVIGAFGRIKNAVGDVITFFKTVFIDGIQLVVDVFLNFVSVLLHGAAAAFGWIPGIGPKLKRARDAFDRFKDGVNAALNGIKNHTISIEAKLGPELTKIIHTQAKTGVSYALKAQLSGFAEGGLVPGLPGKAQAAIVHGGEYVLSRRMLDALGRGVPVGAGVARGGGGAAVPQGDEANRTVHLNIYGDTRSPAEIQRRIEWSKRVHQW